MIYRISASTGPYIGHLAQRSSKRRTSEDDQPRLLAAEESFEIDLCCMGEWERAMYLICFVGTGPYVPPRQRWTPTTPAAGAPF